MAFTGFKEAKAGLPACENVDTTTFNFEKYEKSTHMLGQTATYRATEDNVYVNDVAVVEDLLEALEAYRDGDFLRAGQFIGKIMKIASEEKLEEKAPV